MPLTRKQQNTYDLLITSNFDKVELRDVTSLINSLFNAVIKTPEQEKESKQQKRDAIKGGIKYMAEQPKHKDKSKDELNKEIVNKIKKTSKGEKSTKELRNEEREIYSDVSSEISLPSEDDDQEERKYDDEGQPIKAGDKKASQAAEAEATRQLEAERLATARQAEAVAAPAQAVAAAQAAQAPTENEVIQEERQSLNIGDYIKKGSKFYQDNKKTIDKISGILNKKNIADGSYLTKIASLAYPEIEIWQQAVSTIGLGFTKEDQEKFKLLTGTPEERNQLSTEDQLWLTFKTLINPDQIGVMVNMTAQTVSEEFKDLFYKYKTGKERLKPDQEELKEKIDRRREDIYRERNKEMDLDRWFGKKDKEPTEPINPFKPIHGGSDKISGGGAVYDPDIADDAMFIDPDNWNYIDSYDLMFPPELEGFDDKSFQLSEAIRTGLMPRTFDIKGKGPKSFKDIITGLFIGGKRKPTREEFLDELKKQSPEAYEAYQQAYSDYQNKINKAKLEPTSKVDVETSKSYIENSKQLSKDLLQKAIEKGDISREQASAIYDSWSMYDRVLNGDIEVTYQEMENLQNKLIDTIPKDVLRENSDMVNKFMEDNIDYLQSGWEGDSDLGNFDWLADKLAEGQGGETDGFDPKTGKPKEKKIQPKPKPQAEPKYRYRGTTWGNEDEIFKRTDEEIDRRNLIIEIQRLREELDSTNKLIQSRIKTEQMRFDRTFNMPPPPDSTIKPLPNKFVQNHRAIFQPAVIQNSIRPFQQNSRDEAYYGQYQAWQPTVQESTSRRELLTNQLIFPSVTDMATGGEQKEIAPPSQFNWIENQRFTNAY